MSTFQIVLFIFLAFLAGFMAGIGNATNVWLGGTLVVQDNDDGQPYIFVELEDADKLENNYIMFEIKKNKYTKP